MANNQGIERFLTQAKLHYYGSDNVNKFGTPQQVRERIRSLVECERHRDRIQCSNNAWVLNSRANEIAWLEDVCIYVYLILILI